MDTNFINALHPVFLVKIITLIVIGFYAIFAFVVFTQAKKMGQTLSLPKAGDIIKMISIVHILLVISLFWLALVIL